MKVSRLPIGLRETLQCAFPPRAITFCRQQIRPRQFTTSTTLPAAGGNNFAAREISFARRREEQQANRQQGYDQDGKPRQEEGEEQPFFARVVPSSRSYFTAQPIFTDDLLILRQLLQKYAHLPTSKPGEQPRSSWRGLAEYRDQVGETVKASKYQKIVQLLMRLNQIHPSLVPADVDAVLSEYRRDIDAFKNVPKPVPVDKLGRTLGAGRRKSATARAWVVEGDGQVLVNGKTLAEAFGRVHDRESVIWALKATNRIDKYNVWALAQGGGTTGQAEALTLAVGKALMAHEPALKPALRRGKFYQTPVVVLVRSTKLLTFHDSWMFDS